MDSKIVFELKTLREMLNASIAALDEVIKTAPGLTRYSKGYRDSRIDVLKHLDRILEEVSE